MAKKKETKKTSKKVNEKELKKVTKKLKLNDKNDKYVSDEAREVKRFILILLSIIIAVLIVYGLTIVFKKDNKDVDNDTPTAGAINYDLVSVGTLLNRKNKEYYVIVYSGSNSEAVLYSTIVNNYLSKEKSLEVFFCDLDNKFNKDYYVGENKKSNPKAQKTEEFAFGDLTLLKIKNGRVVKYIEDIDTIKKEFGK